MSDADDRAAVAGGTTVVVGAGPVGLAAAWFLAREGAEVVVVERNPEIGLDTASGSAGVITPSHCVPLAGARVLRHVPSWLLRRGMITIRPRLDPELARFGALTLRAGRGQLMLAGLRALRDQARASRELYAELAESHPDFEFRRAGLMNVCSTPAGFEALAEEAALLEREGFQPRLLEGAAAAEAEPTLRGDVAGGVLWEEDASTAPARAIGALADAAAAAGARIELGAEVKGFRRDAVGRVTEVELATGPLPVRSVVLAAGAETPRLARMLGSRVPIQAAKGHHLHLARFAPAPRIPMIFHEHAMGASAIGEGMRLTGGMDFCGVDRRLDEGRIADILRFAGDYLRDAPDAAAAREQGASRWCGLRPCTPDGLPIVGWTRRAPNAMIAAGHGMLGFTLGPAVGRDVADLVLGIRRNRQEGDWNEQFSPARFGI
jgi:D-amino-acid dehydrogenase